MVFTLSFDVATPAGLADLNTFLQSRSYVVGFSATQIDAQLLAALGKSPDSSKYPNVARFYSHISSFSADARAKFPAAFGGKSSAPAAASAKAAAPAPAPAEEEEDVDLFGDDADAAAAKISASAAKPEPKKEEKKVKKEEIAKSSLVYEVKPLEAGQDMQELDRRIRAIELDGLVWGGEFKIVDVAYGIQKLIVACVIEDEKVSLEDFEEKIIAMEDVVQSVDLINMNKVAGR